jgi:hypothetical protein
MTKFYGVVGYGRSVETKMGVWQDIITERKYFGDEVRASRILVSNAELNDDMSTGTSISILADPYALDNFFAMRFVEWGGTLWKVTNVDPQRPRLILRLGGVYNGPRAISSGTTTPAA